jgi:hypothetical protein
VKGSGKAADLLADVFILTDAHSSEDNDEDNFLQDNLLNRKDQAQAILKDVLQILATVASDASKIDTRAAIQKPLDGRSSIDLRKMDTRAAIQKLLKGWEKEGKTQTDIQRSVDVKLRKLFCDSYEIVQKGKSEATAQNLYKYLRESLEAVGEGLVFVFDLRNSSADVNRELLKCALKSIDSSTSAGDSLGRACYKLKYTMRARDDLVREQLIEVLNEGFLNGFRLCMKIVVVFVFMCVFFRAAERVNVCRKWRRSLTIMFK